jgi:hypothetical protein
LITGLYIGGHDVLDVHHDVVEVLNVADGEGGQRDLVDDIRVDVRDLAEEEVGADDLEQHHP